MERERERYLRKQERRQQCSKVLKKQGNMNPLFELPPPPLRRRKETYWYTHTRTTIACYSNTATTTTAATIYHPLLPPSFLYGKVQEERVS